MSNSVTTVRPATGIDDSAWATVGAGGVVVAALSDDNPATYVHYNAPLVGLTTPPLEFAFAAFAPDASDQLKYLQLWLTMTLSTVDDLVSVTAKIYNPDYSKRLPDQVVNIAYPGLGRYTLLPYNCWPDGTQFSAADLAGLIIRFTVQSATSTTFPTATTDVSDLFLFEAGIDIVYNQAPTVSVDALSAEPWTFGDVRHDFTYSDTEDDAQERYQDRIYSIPSTGWPAGTPDEQIAALEAAAADPVFSEEHVSDLNQTSVAVVPPTGTYRRYIRAADEGSGQRFGLWAYDDFTVLQPAVLRPKLPAVIVTEDRAAASNRLTITFSGTGSAPTAFDVERSDDGGSSWGAILASPVTSVGSPTTVTDRFAPRENLDTLYRVRGLIVSGGSGSGLGVPDRWTSEWVQSSIAVLRSDGNSWLQSPDDASLDLAALHSGTTLVWTSGENQSSFYAQGRAEPLVFGGTIHLRQGTLTWVFTDEAEWVAFTRLRELQSKLLFRSLYGEGPLLDYWIKVGATVTETLVGGYRIMDKGQLRRVQFPVFEVVAPDAGA